MRLTCRFAGVNVSIESVTDGIAGFCAGYAVDAPADFSVRTTWADIESERARGAFCQASDMYIETLAVYRRIAEKLPYYDAFLFHGSAVSVNGAAYVFAAPSGTGKSTHTRLWRELLGSRAIMVNDDKPLIRVDHGGRATVYGTPWDGKHHLSANIAVPVRAICILERAKENSIAEISRSEAMPPLLRQVYRPDDPMALERTLSLIDRMDVRYYRLRCNMDLSAAALSYGAMKKG